MFAPSVSVPSFTVSVASLEPKRLRTVCEPVISAVVPAFKISADAPEIPFSAETCSAPSATEISPVKARFAIPPPSVNVPLPPLIKLPGPEIPPS